MRIGILAAAYPPDIRGGGEISTKLIAESLAEEGAEVFVLAAAESRDEYLQGSVHIQRVSSPNFYWNFRPPKSKLPKLLWHAADNYNPVAVKRISDFIIRRRPDVFLTSTIENFGAAAWQAPAKLGVKTFHKLRSYYPFCAFGTSFKNGVNCNRICLGCMIGSIGRRQASQYVDGVIGLSMTTLKVHLDHGLFRNAVSTVIPDPVSLQLKQHRGFKLRRSPPTFGYLGFLTPNKGIELIADALASTSRLSKARLLIAGTGDKVYLDGLRAQFKGFDCHFLGWQANHLFLEEIDFLVVPSRFREPFGRIVVEAFEAGVPVIGSRTGGIGEMVEEGITGFRFQPGNPADLARSMIAAIELEYQSYKGFSMRARSKANDYVGPAVAKKNIRFFEAVLSNKARPGTLYLED